MRPRVLIPIAFYALLAFLVWFLTSGSVAPCLGLGDNTACYEQWKASRSLIEQAIDSPIPAVALFLALTVPTLWLNRRRPNRSDTTS